MKYNNKFTFATLVYNHSNYIIEHLESIKYQIEEYGDGINVKLIMSDDGSTDNSLELIESWLSVNGGMFFEVVILGDGINRGVGYSYTSVWEHIGEEPFKILAGDDVYSFENVFQESLLTRDYDFVSGFPLLLIDEKIIKSNSMIFHMCATDSIYNSSTHYDKIKKISVINSPSLFYKNKFLKDKATFDFIRKFRVTEDFPMMAKISQQYSYISFLQQNKVYVYYRRTSGSIYLVSNDDFNKDKEDVFNFLLDKDKSLIGRLLMRNRIYCYKHPSLLTKFINLNYFVYAFNIIKYFPNILQKMTSFNLPLRLHKDHYREINERAQCFLNING